jgi:hypothetical protein
LSRTESLKKQPVNYRIDLNDRPAAQCHTNVAAQITRAEICVNDPPDKPADLDLVPSTVRHLQSSVVLDVSAKDNGLRHAAADV